MSYELGVRVTLYMYLLMHRHFAKLLLRKWYSETITCAGFSII